MAEQENEQEPGRRLGGGAIATISGLVVLLIVMAQNSGDVEFEFLFWSVSCPLWLYTFVVAVFGALVWFGLGVIRRHRRRKARRDG